MQKEALVVRVQGAESPGDENLLLESMSLDSGVHVSGSWQSRQILLS